MTLYKYIHTTKVSGLVRIHKELALNKIKEQMGKTTTIPEDPAPKILRKVQRTLCSLKHRFTEKEYKSIYPSDAIPPRMYGVIKAHKPEKDYPMRLIVSTIGTPTYGISNYLVNNIQPTLNKNVTRLKNSYTFKQVAETWEIEPNEVQVSYDVVNLYPSIPIPESIGIVLQQLNNDPEFTTRTKLTIDEVRILLELCLSYCYFLYESDIHVLEDSGPIGLALMVVMAESFLQHHEEKRLTTM